MKPADSLSSLSRRALLRAGVGAATRLTEPFAPRATPASFDKGREHFRPRALAKGVSEATWNRAMAHVEPDTSVFKEMAAQPEFTEATWQYINRRVSDWRIIHGKLALKK